MATTDLRARITRMYEAYNEEKLAALPSLLTKYAGKEAQLLGALVKKYGDEPEVSDAEESTSRNPKAWKSRPEKSAWAFRAGSHCDDQKHRAGATTTNPRPWAGGSTNAAARKAHQNQPAWHHRRGGRGAWGDGGGSVASSSSGSSSGEDDEASDDGDGDAAARLQRLQAALSALPGGDDEHDAALAPVAAAPPQQAHAQRRIEAQAVPRDVAQPARAVVAAAAAAAEEDRATEHYRTSFGPGPLGVELSADSLTTPTFLNCWVVGVVPEGAAAARGVQPGDYVYSVEGTRVEGVSAQGVTQHIVAQSRPVHMVFERAFGASSGLRVPAGSGRCVYEYADAFQDHLNLATNEYVEILEMREDGMWLCRSRESRKGARKVGLVPMNFLEVLAIRGPAPEFMVGHTVGDHAVTSRRHG